MQNNDLSTVSIGMPVYNGELYLRHALDSLLAQNFSQFKLIISDNASTDNTEKICLEYANRDQRIQYFRQKENIGAAPNFQFVLDQAESNLFMWAAYDDQWSENFLTEAANLLRDEKIDFVFPTFEVRSIKLHFSKKFNKEIFRFIESDDRKFRVLQFIGLHHDSHKCNIVYSLFRTEFLRSAIKMQNIGNDGALGTVILGQGKGKLLTEALFSKRYPKFWPGALNIALAWRHSNHLKEFDLAKESALARLKILFPEYTNEIKVIFDNYSAYAHDKYYQICLRDDK